MIRRPDDELGNHGTPCASGEAGRRSWKAPAVQRLITSAAEAGDTLTSDAIELPS